MRTGSQNNSLADAENDEEAPEESLKESVLGFGTTPLTSVVVQPPLDEDDGMAPVAEILPSPVPEAALTTPKTGNSWLDAPEESDEEAGADISVSSATAPSGDGEGESSPPDFSQNSDVDYQSDSADFYLPVSQAVRRGCGLR